MTMGRVMLFAVLVLVAASLSGARLPRAWLGQRLRGKGGSNWAPVGRGFALPHFSTRVTLGRDAGVVALLCLREALALTEPPPDGVPVTRLFFFIPPSPRAHLDTLARLSRAVAQGPLCGLVERSAPDEELFQGLAAADGAHAAEPKREDPA